MSEIETGLAQRLFKSARDLVWQDDTPAKKFSPAKAANPSAAQPESPRQTAASDPASDNTLPDQAACVEDPAQRGMREELSSVILSRPTAYSALFDAISALSDIAMDEGTRYRSAFAVLRKTQQRTVEQIAQAIDVHLGLLDAESERFCSQSKHAEDGEITARMNEANSLQQAVQQLQQQIEQLRQDSQLRLAQLEQAMAQKQSRAQQLLAESEQKKHAILQTTHHFANAVASVKQALTLEKTKISQYLA